MRSALRRVAAPYGVAYLRLKGSNYVENDMTLAHEHTRLMGPKTTRYARKGLTKKARYARSSHTKRARYACRRACCSELLTKGSVVPIECLRHSATCSHALIMDRD